MWVICLDFLQPVLVFTVEPGDGIGQAHAVPGGFCGEKDAEAGADHQRDHANDHDDQHRHASTRRDSQHLCVGNRPQGFEARHDGICNLLGCPFGCCPGCLRGLFGTLHSFGGSGLCKCGLRRLLTGGRYCLRPRYRPRRRFPACRYLKPRQRIMAQAALVDVRLCVRCFARSGMWYVG